MRRSFVLLTLLPAVAAAQAPSQRVLDRYKQMLATNPAEGIALDRLWQAYAEQGRSGELVAEYEAQSTFSGQMILGLLLGKAGRMEDARAALRRASSLEPKNPSAPLALGHLELAAGHGAEALRWIDTAAQLLPDGDPRKSAVLMELGSTALAAGNLAKAAEAWEGTVALSPGDLSLRRQLAETYVRNQLGARAIPHLEFIVQKGSPQERTQAWQQIAAIHQAQGNQDAAIHAVEQALQGVGPTNWLRTELNGQLIRLHQRYHRAAELEEKWKKFAAENPRDLGAYLQLIEFYERTGAQAQQLAWLEKLVILAPKNGEYRLRLARLLGQMDLLDRAAAAYDELLGSEPRNIDLVFERARIDVQRDQPQVAGERIAALLARSGHDEGVRSKALEFYQANRLYDLAEKHLREEAEDGGEEAIVALANFYFSRHREMDARETLGRLLRPVDPPEKRAAGYARIAGEYKSQNDISAATKAIRTAIELKDDVRDYHFMLGELEAACGHYAGAEVAFERAFALSSSPAQALEADQRLYDSLRNQKQPGEDEPRVSLPRPDSAAAVTSAAAQTYLLRLVRDVVEHPSEEKLLRVARWQQWSRNQRLAIDYAERALTLNPKSIAAHDFLARLLALDPQTMGAQQHLRELATLDAGNRTAYLRRLGQVQVQAGQVDEAMKTFRELVQESPGDLDALNDLAIAQQRAEQWNDALATLKQIYTLSPASRRRDAVNALLHVYDRLALRSQAAELLLQQIDAEGELRDRFALYADLLALCTRHGLLDWLRTQFEERHKLRADDYFTEVALGRVLKAQGNKAAAFEVLADAAYSAPDPGEALPELVREAEELHRLDAAVQLQEHYVRVVPQAGPEGLQRLAELQERTLQPDAAAATWFRLVRKFPRDVQVLEKAATFERNWGQPARALTWLRRVRAIEPTNHRALVQLAELDLSDGDPAEAEACLEQVLTQTQPESATDAIRYPAVRPDDPSRLEIAYRSTVRRRAGQPSNDALKALRTFWFEKPEAPTPVADRQSRLEVIRSLAELIAAKGDPASLQAWVARWRQPTSGISERLWALYFAGASGPLLDEVESLITAKPEDAGPVNAFIWLALQTGEFDRLGQWNNDRKRTPSERDFLMVALEQYLDERRGPLPAGLTDKIFPDGQRANLWQAATELAQRGYARPAVQLGQRVLDRLTTQRAPFAFELAQWQLQLGELAPAQKTLRAALGGSGDSLNSALYAAMRALYLLLPENERAAFADQCVTSINETTQPVQAALARALLAGLDGEFGKARTQLDRLIELRAMASINDERSTAAGRQWEFVLAAGVQFVAWQLDTLAVDLWQRALADEASISLQVQAPAPQGDAIRARVLEVRTRLAALKLMRCEPGEVGEILENYGRYASPDGLLPLAEALELFGANPVAVEIYRRLWSAEPANPHALRNALNACRNASDRGTLEEILTRVVTEGHFKPNEAAHRDLVMQLVDVLASRGELEGARKLLAELVEKPPHDARILLKLADLQQRGGQPVPAEATYRRLLAVEPTNVAARVALASLLDAQGKTVDAVDILERASGAEIDARLATLNLKIGRTEESLAALERLPDNDRPRVSLALANDLATRGDGERARRILRAALARRGDPKMGFTLQSRLVELLPADGDRAGIQRDVRRLRQFVDGEAGTLANYYGLMQREARRLGLDAELRDDLMHAWDGGRGEVAAGAAWLVWQMNHAAAEAARTTWTQLGAHPLLDLAALQTVLDALPADGEVALRVEVLARQARLDPGEPQRLVTWAKGLMQAKRGDEAAGVARELSARAAFNPELLATSAELYAALGDSSHAGEYYRRAANADPTGQKPEIHAAYIRLLLAQGQLKPARAELRVACRNAAANPVPLIMEYLTAAGRIPEFESELSDLPLGAARWPELRLGVFKHLLKTDAIEPALALVERYPELLQAGSTDLREAARRAGQFAKVVGLFDLALAQGNAGVSPALAALLADWAEDELKSLQEDAAIDHLERAHELQLGVWTITERLARLHLERNQPQLAARTLQTFLAVATDPAEKDKATQMLARIPGA